MLRSFLRSKLLKFGWCQDQDGYWRHSRYPWFFKLGWFFVQLWNTCPEGSRYLGRRRYKHLHLTKNPPDHTTGLLLGPFLSPLLDSERRYACYIWQKPKRK